MSRDHDGQGGFDFPDPARFASEYDEMMAGLEIAAGLFRSELDVLKAPTPGENKIKEVLDFFAPWGAGRACFFAYQYLELGQINVAVDEDYDVIAARVRQQVQRMQADGRIKADGQRRQTKPKPVPAGQGDLDLFGGE